MQKDRQGEERREEKEDRGAASLGLLEPKNPTRVFSILPESCWAPTLPSALSLAGAGGRLGFPAATPPPHPGRPTRREAGRTKRGRRGCPGLLGGPEGLGGVPGRAFLKREGREGQERVETEQGTAGPHEREVSNGRGAKRWLRIRAPWSPAGSRGRSEALPDLAREAAESVKFSTSGGEDGAFRRAAPASGWGAAAPHAASRRAPPAGPRALVGSGVRRGCWGGGRRPE